MSWMKITINFDIPFHFLFCVMIFFNVILCWESCMRNFMVFEVMKFENLMLFILLKFEYLFMHRILKIILN